MSVAVAIAGPAMTTQGSDVKSPPDATADTSKAPAPGNSPQNIALKIPPIPPTASPTATKRLEEVQEVEGEKEEESTPTPTSSSLSSSIVFSSSSASSSPSTSPSPSSSMDACVASDANRCDLTSDKDAREEHKVMEQVNGEKNDSALPTVSNLDPNADTDVKHADSATITTTPPLTSVSSTPASSSSTSLPATPPSSSPTPTSTTPSTTNVNDSSADSNGLPSLLRPRSHPNPNLNVKFAPLPELAPRKRKSSTPLGMAARSQLARRRRTMYQDPYDDDAGYEDPYRTRRNHYTGPPEISEKEQIEGGMEGGQGKGSGKKKTKKKAEVAGQAEDGGKKVKEKKEKSQREEGERQSEAENDDPFVLLARKMGKAGRHIWKRMASGGKNGKEGVAGEEKEQQRVVLATVTTDPEEERQKEKERQERGEDGVWTEEVGEQYRKMQEQRVKDSMEPDAPVLRATSSSPPPPESRNSDQERLPEELASPTVETDREGERDQIQEKDLDVKGVKSDEKANGSLMMAHTPVSAS